MQTFLKIQKNKTKTAITIFAILLMASMSLTVIPVNAQSEIGPHGFINEKSGGSIPLPSGVTPDVQFDSIAHLSFRPNPVGLNQPILVNLWMQPPIDVSHFFSEFDVTFTKPDGTQQVVKKESYRADGTAWFDYVVDQVGNWTIQFDFPGAYFPAGNYTVYAGAFFSQTSDTIVNFPQSCYYKPSHDGPYTFTVQNEQVASSAPITTANRLLDKTNFNREQRMVANSRKLPSHRHTRRRSKLASRHKHIHEQLPLHTIRSSAK